MPVLNPDVFRQVNNMLGIIQEMHAELKETNEGDDPSTSPQRADRGDRGMGGPGLPGVLDPRR
jgi:hypothetical protein